MPKVRRKVLVIHSVSQIHSVIDFRSVDSLIYKIKKKFTTELEREQERISDGEVITDDLPYHAALEALRHYDFENIGDMRLLVPKEYNEFLEGEQLAFTVTNLNS